MGIVSIAALFSELQRQGVVLSFKLVEKVLL
jgi:hypothetical protein